MRHVLLAAVLFAGVSADALAQNGCTRDILNVRGTPVTVNLCVVGAPAASASIATVDLAATYAAGNRSFVQHASVRFITGEGPSRALESTDLSPLGIAGVLHMTLLYGGNQVTIEHAMLTPGAVRVK